MATFGERIAERRKFLRLTLRALASRVLKEDGAPISAPYLHDLEKDRRNPPRDHLIDQFARALDLPPDYLFLLAGVLPPDIRSASVTAEQAVEAFYVFRRMIGVEA